MEPLLSVSDALERILSEIRPLDAERVATADAQGRVLAEDVISSTDLPPFANSAMDGYAVRSKDIALATRDAGVTLPVAADIPAGAAPLESLPPNAAARIMTGAPMPGGADAIVPVEDTDDSRDQRGGRAPAAVRIFRAFRSGAFVRPAGQDVRKGETVIRAGSVLRPQELGVMAALGVAEIPVNRRPRVAVLVSGDELLGIDEPLTPGKIRDVNGYTVAGLVHKYGGIPIALGIARDNPDDIQAKLDAAVARSADLIISSAGVSVGAFDFIKDVVEARGRLAFWRVNMRPGKPVAFGEYKGIPFVGLPGNPVSTMVSFEVFARPALLKMCGHINLRKPAVPVTLSEDINSDGRESYLRARVEQTAQGYVARMTGDQGSGILSSMVKANALLVVPAGVHRLSAGERLTAWMLDWPEDPLLNY